MRRRKDTNKGEIITKHGQTMAAKSCDPLSSASLCLFTAHRAARYFLAGSDGASSENTPNGRSGASLRRYVPAANNSSLKFTSIRSRQPKPFARPVESFHTKVTFLGRGRDRRMLELFPMTTVCPPLERH